MSPPLSSHAHAYLRDAFWVGLPLPFAGASMQVGDSALLRPYGEAFARPV